MKLNLKILPIIISIFSIVLVCISLFWGYNFYLKKAYPIKYENFVKQACKKYHVEESLVFAVIRAESKFQENAQSNAGAIGLMQITPDTFKWLLKKASKEPLDETYLATPEVNIEYGTYFLSILKEKYIDKKVVLSAYNAGMGKVDKWLKTPEYSSNGKILKEIPYPETEKYVDNVLSYQTMYEKLYYNKKTFFS